MTRNQLAGGKLKASFDPLVNCRENFIDMQITCSTGNFSSHIGIMINELKFDVVFISLFSAL